MGLGLEGTIHHNQGGFHEPSQGIANAKQVFQLHNMTTQGKVFFKKRFPRSGDVKFITNLPACVVGKEVCGRLKYRSDKFSALKTGSRDKSAIDEILSQNRQKGCK